jgi:integration host factor subunit beta
MLSLCLVFDIMMFFYKTKIFNMIKSELINSIASKHAQLSHEDVEAAVNAMLKNMTDELANGGGVEIRGFGSFSLRYRAPKIARNPKTGAAVAVEQKHAIHFKPGTDLRKRVDDSSKQYPIQKL